MFHDVRWGDSSTDGRFLWVLLNSGSAPVLMHSTTTRATLKGVHSYRQPAGSTSPTPGGTFTRVRACPGHMTWARAYIKGGRALDGHRPGRSGEAFRPRFATPGGTARPAQWPFMAADMGIGRDTLMAHYLSNHVAVAYGDIFEEMVALSAELGFEVRILRDPD